jgi:predicted RND superfamily exporter protein
MLFFLFFLSDENFEIYFESSDDENAKANEGEEEIVSNLLKLSKLKSLCEWDKKVLKMMNLKEKPCYFSLPFAVALFNNKTSCDDLVEDDVDNFLYVLNECKQLYSTGILFAAAEENKQQPKIAELLKETNPKTIFLRIPSISNNICFKKNLIYLIYEYVMSSEFTLNFTDPLNETLKFDNYMAKYSSIWIKNEKRDQKEQIMSLAQAYDFYLKFFHNQQYNDKETKITGINLIGVRQDAAMRFISQDMILVALAISLICLTTLLYLRSISIAMIVNLGVALSVGVAFFAYRIVYNIELFPFINMMAAFLLIGIACDNVYVLFDAWSNEKSNILMLEFLKYKEDNPNGDAILYLKDCLNKQLKHIEIFIDKSKFKKSPVKKEMEKNHDNEVNKSFIETDKKQEILIANNNITSEVDDDDDDQDFEFNPMFVRYAILTEKQMIRVMGGTLRHAASSIFVTSFTTAAAFITNMITRLPYVQLFGLFTGTCILVYFFMIITMISAFVVLYEKYSNRYICELPLRLNKIRVLIDRLMSLFTSINAKMVAKYLPYFIIKARLALVIIFLIIGTISMITVFYKPKLKPPTQWRYQFFESSNLFEKFEFNLRDRFLSYANNEKRNLTNPEIYFLFGIIDKDTGSKFNPEDDGFLVFDPDFDFLSKESQSFIDNFINVELASRRDLFLVDEIKSEWNAYLGYMNILCNLNVNNHGLNKSILPIEPETLKKCQIELNSLLVNSSITQFFEMMAVFPRHIVFIPKNDKIVGILLRVNSNCTFSDFEAVRDYYLKVEEFHQEKFPLAPDGYKTGWFISVGFALYDLQYQLMTGTYASLITSMGIAFIVLLLTSGNIFISIYAIITISFSIALTVAVFVLLGWELSILESVIIIMSVGLSVDFSCHYGVAYIKAEVDDLNCRKYSRNHSKFFSTNNSAVEAKDQQKKLNNKLHNLFNIYKESNKERFLRINDAFKRMGSAVAMAAFTTFLAGLSMYPSNLTSFSKMGQFLMLVMITSYVYATFFFVPLCALFGPTNNFGDIKLKAFFEFLSRKIINCVRLDNKSDNNNKESPNRNKNKNKAVKMKQFNKKKAETNDPNI